MAISASAMDKVAKATKAALTNAGYSEGVVSLNGLVNFNPIDRDNFQVGDVFTFPDQIQWIPQIIDRNDPTRLTYYMFVAVERGGNTTVIPFYASTIGKSRRVAKNGKVSDETKRTSGTLVDEKEKYATIDEFYAAMAGRSVKVTAVDRIEAVQYSDPQPQVGEACQTVKTSIMTLDLV